MSSAVTPVGGVPEHPGYVLVCSGYREFQIPAPKWHLALKWARSRAREHLNTWLIYEGARGDSRPGDLLMVVYLDKAGNVRVTPAR